MKRLIGLVVLIYLQACSAQQTDRSDSNVSVNSQGEQTSIVAAADIGLHEKVEGEWRLNLVEEERYSEEDIKSCALLADILNEYGRKLGCWFDLNVGLEHFKSLQWREDKTFEEWIPVIKQKYRHILKGDKVKKMRNAEGKWVPVSGVEEMIDIQIGKLKRFDLLGVKIASAEVDLNYDGIPETIISMPGGCEEKPVNKNQDSRIRFSHNRWLSAVLDENGDYDPLYKRVESGAPIYFESNLRLFHWSPQKNGYLTMNGILKQSETSHNPPSLENYTCQLHFYDLDK